MKLYIHPLSGHCHRVIAFLSIANIEADLVPVDLLAGEHRSESFLALNSFGQVPVLVDDETIICDSIAIMVYIAKKYNLTAWLPEEAEQAAQVQRWLSVAAGQLAYGPGAARLITVFGAENYQADEVISRAHEILKLIDSQLNENSFITGKTPTIADIALYGYIDRAPEGNVDLTPYANVKRWLGLIESMPGFVPFKKTAAGLETAAS